MTDLMSWSWGAAYLEGLACLLLGIRQLHGDRASCIICEVEHILLPHAQDVRSQVRRSCSCLSQHTC